MDLIQILKALGDETRMRILNILKDRPLCVCEIEAILNITQSNASRHLNKLTNAGIVDYRKMAKYVYYQLDEETLTKYPFMKMIIETEAGKLKVCQKDAERSKNYTLEGPVCE